MAIARQDLAFLENFVLGERCLDLHPPCTISPVQGAARVCTADYPQTRIDSAFIRAEFPHPDAFYYGPFLEEVDARMRKRAESVSQYKLSTRQQQSWCILLPSPFLPVIQALPFFAKQQSYSIQGLRARPFLEVHCNVSPIPVFERVCEVLNTPYFNTDTGD